MREIAARLGAEACELDAPVSEACVGREVSTATRGAVGAGAGSAGAALSTGAAVSLTIGERDCVASVARAGDGLRVQLDGMEIAADVVALWGLCAYGSRENLEAA